MVGRRHVSTPAKAAHYPSSWCRSEGLGLPVHHFEVWRHDQRDPVFVYGRCMRRRTGRYGAKLHRWTLVLCIKLPAVQCRRQDTVLDIASEYRFSASGRCRSSGPGTQNYGWVGHKSHSAFAPLIIGLHAR